MCFSSVCSSASAPPALTCSLLSFYSGVSTPLIRLCKGLQFSSHSLSDIVNVSFACFGSSPYLFEFGCCFLVVSMAPQLFPCLFVSSRCLSAFLGPTNCDTDSSAPGDGHKMDSSSIIFSFRIALSTVY